VSRNFFAGLLVDGDGACKYESSHRAIQRFMERVYWLMIKVHGLHSSPRVLHGTDSDTCMYLCIKCALKRGPLLLTKASLTSSQVSTRALSQAGSWKHRRSFLSTCPDYLSDPRDDLPLACPVLPS